jgi:hypothetical protein
MDDWLTIPDSGSNFKPDGIEGKRPQIFHEGLC